MRSIRTKAAKIRSRCLPLVVGLGALSAWAQPSIPTPGEPNQTWAGRRIVTLKDFGDYFVSDGVGPARLIKPDGLSVNIVAVVDRVDGDRIWIRGNGFGDASVGWLNKTDAILLDNAISYFSSLIERSPNNWDAYLRRAESEHALNQRDGAIVDYTRAIELNPDESFLFLRRGRSFRTIGGCAQAAADFERAARLRPHWAEPYNLEAGVYSDCPDPAFRDPGKAVTLIEHAIALDIEHPTYLTVLALAYSRSGNLEKAAVTQRQAIESPRFPSAYHEDALRQLRDYESALAAQKH